MKRRNTRKQNNVTEIKIEKKKHNKRNFSKKEINSYGKRTRNEKKENNEIEVIDLNSSNIEEKAQSPKRKKSKKSTKKRAKKKPIEKDLKSILINLDESEGKEKNNEKMEDKAPHNITNIKRKKVDNIFSIYEIIESSKNDNNDVLKKSTDCPSKVNIKKLPFSDCKNDKKQKKGRKSKNKTVSKISKLLNRKRRKKDEAKIKEEIVNSNCRKINSRGASQKSSKRSRTKSFSFIDNKSIKTELEKIEEIGNKPEIQKEKLNSELNMFYYLIQEYDIENIVDSIYNCEAFPKNKLNLFINKIVSYFGINGSITIFLKSAITLIKQNSNENNDILNDNNSFHAKKTSLNFKPGFKDNKNNNLSVNSQENIEKINLDDIESNSILSKSDNNNNYNYNFNLNDNIDFNDVSLRKDRVWSIESHYNRDKDGKIYKYEVGYLFQKYILFLCHDHRCKGKGTYDLGTKKFKVITKHNLEHVEHNYIANSKKNSDSIYQEMMKKEYLDSQVSKEGKSTIVRFYS